jgi:signal transduction histidine kinase
VLLFRLAPEPWSRLANVGLFMLLFAITGGIAAAAALPIAMRVRTLAQAARDSVRQDYSGMTPIRGRDEISSLGSIFNDTAADIRARITDAKDREEALRRYVASTTEDIAAPLAALEAPIARLAAAQPAGSAEQQLARETTLEAHRLAMRLHNLAAASKLRTITETTPRERVDLSAICTRVLASRETLAAAAQVDCAAAAIDAGVSLDADAELVELAIANLVDNAILYAGAGARVRLELRGYEQGRRFALRVVDTGRGVDDEEFAGLTANRRFRGDEAKTRRPGGRGLGLSLTREVADRFGLTLELRRPTTGGFEAEIATRR